MSYLFVPGTEESTSDCESRCRLLARSVGWRGKLRPAKSWSAACRKGGWIQRLFGQMPRPSTADHGVESWIASLRASRANHGASAADSADLKTSGTLASTLSAPLVRWDQDSCSWKTSPGLFDRDFPTFSGDWPSSGTMHNGACFPLQESAPLTKDRASSFWPTPQAETGGTSNNGCPGDGRDEYATKGRPQLHTMLRAWSPPLRLVQRQTSPDTPAASGRAENAEFVGWMMGLPEGWTSSECSATAWFHWLQLMRSALSPHESTHKP